MVELRGYGDADTFRWTSGIFVNGLLTMSPGRGVTIVTIAMTEFSCTVTNTYASYDTQTAVVQTELYDTMMAFPTGSIILGISKDTTIDSGTLPDMSDVDDEYGTRFTDLQLRGTQIFMVKRGDPSFAKVFLCSTRFGPLQWAHELKPFAKGTCTYLLYMHRLIK